GHDLGVGCRAYTARTLWLLGYPVQALAQIYGALALAHELSHPYSLAFARCLAAGSCTSPLRIIVLPRKPGTMPPYHPIGRALFAMIPQQFYYQLVVLGLLWLCVMLHFAWPSRDVTTQTKPAKPLTPRRQRSTEPKPFAGLTHKPHCALCAQETGETAPAPPRRPDPMPSTNRRPRTVDTSMHFCPHPACDYRGWLGLNNLRANGHPSGGPSPP